MKNTDFIYWAGTSEDSANGEDGEYGAGVKWTSKNYYNTSLPLVRLYWKALSGMTLADGTVLTEDKVIVDTVTYGDKVDNYKKNLEGANNCIAYFTKKFKQYVRQDAPEPEEPTVSYDVTFIDYDGSELSRCTALSGEDADPPANPTRSGYTFAGWQPSYENITSDTSCVAQYNKTQTVYNGSRRTIPIYDIGPESTRYKYSDSEFHTITFSDNVIGYNV